MLHDDGFDLDDVRTVASVEDNDDRMMSFEEM